MNEVERYKHQLFTALYWEEPKIMHGDGWIWVSPMYKFVCDEIFGSMWIQPPAGYLPRWQPTSKGSGVASLDWRKLWPKGVLHIDDYSGVPR